MYSYHNNAVIIACICTGRECDQLLSELRLFSYGIECSLRNICNLLIIILLVGSVLEVVKHIVAQDSYSSIKAVAFCALFGFKLDGRMLLRKTLALIIEQGCKNRTRIHIVTVNDQIITVGSTACIKERYTRNAVVSVEAPIKIFFGIVRSMHGNVNVEPERIPMNIHFKSPGDKSYMDILREMETDGRISRRGLRAYAVLFDEVIFDVNTMYFEERGGYDYAKEFFAEAYRYACEKYGEENIISAVMHADEINKAVSDELGHPVYHYHMHLIALPVVEKEIRWSKR